jgi:hypothetical protein
MRKISLSLIYLLALMLPAAVSTAQVSITATQGTGYYLVTEEGDTLHLRGQTPFYNTYRTAIQDAMDYSAENLMRVFVRSNMNERVDADFGYWDDDYQIVTDTVYVDRIDTVFVETEVAVPGDTVYVNEGEVVYQDTVWIHTQRPPSELLRNVNWLHQSDSGGDRFIIEATAYGQFTDFEYVCDGQRVYFQGDQVVDDYGEGVAFERTYSYQPDHFVSDTLAMDCDSLQFRVTSYGNGYRHGYLQTISLPNFGTMSYVEKIKDIADGNEIQIYANTFESGEWKNEAKDDHHLTVSGASHETEGGPGFLDYFDFDGVVDVAHTAHHADLGNFGVRNVTFGVWVETKNETDFWDVIFGKGPSDFEFRFNSDDPGTLRFNPAASSQGINNISPAHNEWTFFVFTWNQSTLTAYRRVDSDTSIQQVGSASLNDTDWGDNTNPFKIGARGTVGDFSRHFRGWVAGYFAVEKVLTTQEMDDIYDATFVSPGEPASFSGATLRSVDHAAAANPATNRTVTSGAEASPATSRAVTSLAEQSATTDRKVTSLAAYSGATSRALTKLASFAGDTLRALQSTANYSGATLRQVIEEASASYSAATQRKVISGADSVGVTQRKVTDAAEQSGATERKVTAHAGATGATLRVVSHAATFAGSTVRTLKAAASYSGATLRQIIEEASASFSGATSRSVIKADQVSSSTVRKVTDQADTAGATHRKVVSAAASSSATIRIVKSLAGFAGASVRAVKAEASALGATLRKVVSAAAAPGATLRSVKSAATYSAATFRRVLTDIFIEAPKVTRTYMKIISSKTRMDVLASRTRAVINTIKTRIRNE